MAVGRITNDVLSFDLLLKLKNENYFIYSPFKLFQSRINFRRIFIFK